MRTETRALRCSQRRGRHKSRHVHRVELPEKHRGRVVRKAHLHATKAYVRATLQSTGFSLSEAPQLDNGTNSDTRVCRRRPAEHCNLFQSTLHCPCLFYGVRVPWRNSGIMRSIYKPKTSFPVPACVSRSVNCTNRSV